MTEEAPQPWYKINTRLLPVKGIYFLWVSALGVLPPFIPIYMKQLGLSSTEVGFMYGVMPFISFFMRPIFGAIADKTKRPKIVIILCMLFTGICYILLLKAPPKQQNVRVLDLPSIELHCGRTSSFVQICSPGSFAQVNQIDSVHIKSISTPSIQTKETGSKEGTVTLNVSGGLIRCRSVCKTFLNGNITFSKGGVVSRNESCSLSHTDRHIFPEFLLNIDKHRSFNDYLVENRTGDKANCSYFKMESLVYNENIYEEIVCDSETVFDCSKPVQQFTTSKSKAWTPTFLIYFVIYLFCNIFYAPVLSLIDAIAYDILGDKRRHWGRQRVWGTIGYISFGVTSTYIMDAMSISADDIDFSISFYILAVLCVCSSVVTYLIQISDALQTPKMLKNIKDLLKYTEVVVFLVVVTFFGILNSVVEAFLFWFLKDLGSSQIILGLCLLFNGLPGIIILYFAGSIMKRIGEVPCLYIGALAYAIQFFSYSVITNPWYVLPVELLHCLTFGLFYAAASAYGSRITPSGMSGTIQGLIGGLYFGFGKGVGSLITGKLMDPESGLGSRWTFRFYGFVSISLLVSYASIYTLYFRKKKEKTSLTTELKVVETRDDGSQPTESLLDKDQTKPTAVITDTDKSIP